jgi:predicted nuclease of predicted toxin-antitoxin system
MKILIDMNLSPEWVERFAAEGIEAIHWSTIGDPKAEDAQIMQIAREGDYVVFTHDLDFSAILAATEAVGPSVIQVRAQDLMSNLLANLVITVLKGNEATLKRGAIITIDHTRARMRILPLRML